MQSEFKVGDRVRLNPNYSDDPVEGVITDKVNQWGAHEIEWSDGEKGDIYLDGAHNYLVKIN